MADDEYEFFEVPDDDDVNLVVYDALHASWHNPKCQRNCQEFLKTWYKGFEFTAEDIALVTRALVDYYSDPVLHDPTGYTTGPPKARVVPSGGTVPHTITPTTTTISTTGAIAYPTSYPVREPWTTTWAENRRKKNAWDGDRKGRR